jgi:predicted DNA-binding mobile mystery protein A
MDYWKHKILRQQLDKKMASLKDLAESGMPDSGWIKSIRTSLGMTLLDLALRVGIDQSRISRLEKAEKKGNVKLSSMQKIASALDMEFVYGFVPKTTLENMVFEQGVKYTNDRLQDFMDVRNIDLHVYTEMENGITKNDLIQELLLNKKPKRFWKRR